MNLHIDPAEFTDLIQAAVNAAVQRLQSNRPTGNAGQILLTKRQAAASLGVSEATVDRWRAEAGLPCVKIDGKVLFRPPALEVWATEREGAVEFRQAYESQQKTRTDL